MAFNFSPKVVTDGLVLYLDAANTKSYIGSGTTWNDISRSGNSGTLVNGPTFSRANNGYIRCDGFDDYISIPNTPLLKFGSSNFTIEYWFRKLTTTTGYDNIWGPNTWNTGGSPGTNEWIITIGNGNTGEGDAFSLGVEVGTTVYGTGDSTTLLSLNTWYQLVAVREGGNMKMYLNSVLNMNVNPAGFTASSVINNVPSREIRLGNSGLNNLYTNVDNSQLKIYNRALSATEVLQNYNATKSRYI
jgi:hypothetical protein